MLGIRGDCAYNGSRAAAIKARHFFRCRFMEESIVVSTRATWLSVGAILAVLLGLHQGAAALFVGAPNEEERAEDGVRAVAAPWNDQNEAALALELDPEFIEREIAEIRRRVNFDPLEGTCLAEAEAAEGDPPAAKGNEVPCEPTSEARPASPVWQGYAHSTFTYPNTGGFPPNAAWQGYVNPPVTYPHSQGLGPPATLLPPPAKYIPPAGSDPLADQPLAKSFESPQDEKFSTDEIFIGYIELPETKRGKKYLVPLKARSGTQLLPDYVRVPRYSYVGSAGWNCIQIGPYWEIKHPFDDYWMLDDILKSPTVARGERTEFFLFDMVSDREEEQPLHEPILGEFVETDDATNAIDEAYATPWKAPAVERANEAMEPPVVDFSALLRSADDLEEIKERMAALWGVDPSVPYRAFGGIVVGGDVEETSDAPNPSIPAAPWLLAVCETDQTGSVDAATYLHEDSRNDDPTGISRLCKLEEYHFYCWGGPPRRDLEISDSEVAEIRARLNINPRAGTCLDDGCEIEGVFGGDSKDETRTQFAASHDLVWRLETEAHRREQEGDRHGSDAVRQAAQQLRTALRSAQDALESEPRQVHFDTPCVSAPQVESGSYHRSPMTPSEAPFQRRAWGGLVQ